jgi:hypothetical protein
MEPSSGLASTEESSGFSADSGNSISVSLPDSNNPAPARPTNLRGLPRRNYALIAASSVKIPESYEEAMASSFREEWSEAMQQELTALESKGTWVKVDRPPYANVIKNRWVYAVKTDSHGNVVKFSSIYVLRKNDNFVFLLLWVDDFLVAGNPRELLESVKKSILSQF